MKIEITELTPITLTRKRGIDAYRSLLRLLDREETVDIGLDVAIMMSMSFLDELIWRLAEAGFLKRIAFVTRKSAMRRKLGSIAHARDVNIYFRKSADDSRAVSVPRVSMQGIEPRLQKS
jgi:hypothetical protein